MTDSNCCKYKANGTRKESQNKIPKREQKKTQKLKTLCFIARVQDTWLASNLKSQTQGADSSSNLEKRSLPFDLVSFLVCHNIYLGLHLTYNWYFGP